MASVCKEELCRSAINTQEHEVLFDAGTPGGESEKISLNLPGSGDISEFLFVYYDKQSRRIA